MKPFLVFCIVVLLVMFAYQSRKMHLPTEEDVARAQRLLDEMAHKCPHVADAARDIKAIRVCGNTCQSSTIDKQVIYVQTRDASGKLHDDDFVREMLVHEITHVVTPEVGHTPLFVHTFQDLAECALA